jgi:hypothetical protein
MSEQATQSRSKFPGFFVLLVTVLVHLKQKSDRM